MPKVQSEEIRLLLVTQRFKLQVQVENLGCQNVSRIEVYHQRTALC